jgi:hypothetical protein
MSSSEGDVTSPFLRCSAFISALVLLAGCSQRTWAADWKADMSRARTEIRALVPPETTMANAKRLMDAKGMCLHGNEEQAVDGE